MVVPTVRARQGPFYEYDDRMIELRGFTAGTTLNRLLQIRAFNMLFNPSDEKRTVLQNRPLVVILVAISALWHDDGIDHVNDAICAFDVG
jgi:hypothetical protein